MSVSCCWARPGTHPPDLAWWGGLGRRRALQAAQPRWKRWRNGRGGAAVAGQSKLSIAPQDLHGPTGDTCRTGVPDGGSAPSLCASTINTPKRGVQPSIFTRRCPQFEMASYVRVPVCSRYAVYRGLRALSFAYLYHLYDTTKRARRGIPLLPRGRPRGDTPVTFQNP